MKSIFVLFISLLFSFSLLAQGTMSTDDTQASEAAASMSGTTDEEIDLREEEVQMQEEDFMPGIDDEPIIIEQQEDPERIQDVGEEVEY